MGDVFLLPGEYCVCRGSSKIRTLLGSCVSITLWHPGTQTGAMAHYLLPKRSGQCGYELSAHYGEEALVLMVREFVRMGLLLEECEAKIFGGGTMFPTIERGLSGVGRKNGDAARLLLQTHGIAVASESLFGDGHRKIIFNVKTGDVWCRQINPNESMPTVNKVKT